MKKILILIAIVLAGQMAFSQYSQKKVERKIQRIVNAHIKKNVKAYQKEDSLFIRVGWEDIYLGKADQNFAAPAYFPTIDSIRRFVARYIRNSAIEAFTNLRLNTALMGMLQMLDSAKLTWGGGVPDTLYGYRSSDSIYFKVGVNGTPVYMWKDSVGTGGGGGSGDVVGPSSSTVNRFAFFSNGTGKLLKEIASVEYDPSDYAIYNTSPGSTNGAVLDLRTFRATPVINDRLAEFHIKGYNVALAETQYFALYAQSKVITTGAEVGEAMMNVRVNGTDREFFNATNNATNNGVKLELCRNYYFDETTGKFVINNSSVPTTDYVHLEYTNNGQVLGGLTNINTGSSAYAEWNVSNNNTLSAAGGLRLIRTGTNWSATGIYKQDAAVIGSGTGLAGGLSIGALHASGVLRLYTGGEADANERMNISSTGNVIIKNLDTDLTAPTTSGTLKMVVTDANGQLSFDNIGGGGGSPGGSDGDIQKNVSGSFAASIANETSNIFKITGVSSSLNSNATLRVNASATQGFYAGYNTASSYGFIGAATDGASHDLLVISPSGSNVTVGGTTSSHKLRVQGDFRAGAGTDASGVAGNIAYFTNDGNSSFSLRNGTADQEFYLFAGTSGSETGTIIGSVTNHDVFFRTNNATVGVMKAGGNFIWGGTTDGGEKFQVNGSVALDLGSDANYDMLTRGSGGALQRIANGTTGQYLTATTGGAQTWTTPAYSSGQYTPTLTNLTNVAASTAFQCQWTRIGNVVHVSGKVSIDPTSGSSTVQLGISLPVASGFAATEELAGTAVAPNIQGLCAAILADNVNSRAELQFIHTDTGNNTFWFTFTYFVTPP